MKSTLEAKAKAQSIAKAGKNRDSDYSSFEESDGAEDETTSAAPQGASDEVRLEIESICKTFNSKDWKAAAAAFAAIEMLASNILSAPKAVKYRRLRGVGGRLRDEVLARPEAMQLLRLAGFVGNGDDLMLPSVAPLHSLATLRVTVMAALATAPARDA